MSSVSHSSTARRPRVVVLGGGPAGVGAAFQLRRLDRADVTLVEARTEFGGNSGSFTHAGQRLDYGSHRLHPACDPSILADIRSMLGADLLDRPRHGRIRLMGRWIHFPLKPLDLAIRAHPAFALGTVRDMATRLFGADGQESLDESFASVMRANLGRTICEQFYFPYARKIWGAEPSELSPVQARRRVAASSFAKLIRKVLSAVPGLKPAGAGRFYYPRGGFGQISEAYAEAARAAGTAMLAGWRVTSLAREHDGWCVQVERDVGAARDGGGETHTLRADYVWSTLPITQLARITQPAPPAEVLAATRAMEYRAMLLVYVTLPVDRFTEFDAHYFPESHITITRLSEPKNYAMSAVPTGSTTLCAELPCAPDDNHWGMSDTALGDLVAANLTRAGLPLPASPTGVHVRRLRFAYPIYRRGYEEAFTTLDRWASSQPQMLSFGRQGLFAHDNTHHALRMAYAAADCLGSDGFDTGRWASYRSEFETHVVED